MHCIDIETTILIILHVINQYQTYYGDLWSIMSLSISIYTKCKTLEIKYCCNRWINVAILRRKIGPTVT